MMKLHDAGRPVEPLYEMIAANVRTPEEVPGDLHSQVVGNEVGPGSSRALTSRLDDVEALADRSSRRSGRAGAYLQPRTASTATLTIDGFEQPIEIRAAVGFTATS